MHPSVRPVAAAACLLGLLLPVAAGAQTALLKDTFSDDAPGANPNGPEVGTAYYPGLSVPATSTTTYTVIDDGGDLRLRVTAPGPADSGDNGSLIDYFPVERAAVTRVDYRYRLDAGAALVGRNAFGQELVLSPGGTNYMLAWSADGHLWAGASTAGLGGFDLRDTGYAYASDRMYAVSMLVEVPAGRVSLHVDGAPIQVLDGLALLGGVGELAFFNNFASTGSSVIDDVRITAVPEPGAGALFALGVVVVGGAGAWRRKGSTPAVSPVPRRGVPSPGLGRPAVRYTRGWSRTTPRATRRAIVVSESMPSV